MEKSNKWIAVMIGALLAIGALYLPWVKTASTTGVSQHSAIEVIKASFLEGGALIYSGIAIVLGAVLLVVVLVLSMTLLRKCQGTNCHAVPFVVLSLLSAAAFVGGLVLSNSYYAKINVLQEINYQVSPAFGFILTMLGIAIIILSSLPAPTRRPS